MFTVQREDGWASVVVSMEKRADVERDCGKSLTRSSRKEDVGKRVL